MKLKESFLQNIERALDEIDIIFTENEIHYCVIGGIALQEYNYFRTTDDIDLLIDKEDYHKLSYLPIGYIRKISNKIFHLHNPEIEINTISSGEHAGDVRGIPYLHTEEVEKFNANGIPIMRLKYLVEYKVCSGIYGKRLRDFGDVQELIKKNKLSENYLSLSREDIKNKYIEIWNGTY